MSDCKHCGKPAGLFKKVHQECETAFKEGSNRIVAEALASIKRKDEFTGLKSRIDAVAIRSHIGTDEEKSLMVAAWEKAVDLFLDDGVLEEKEEASLVRFKKHFMLKDEDVDKRGFLTKTVKAGALRELLEGKIPKRVTFSGVALNLQKGEEIIWAFPNTEYLEDKTRRRYVGQSHGVSVRIMKGVYYRTSAFRGHPVEYEERVSRGHGVMVLTNKHIYFHGAEKSFRIAYQKIVSFEPYSDGIGVIRDAANAKAQTFINGDGWFTFNIISNINNINSA